MKGKNQMTKNELIEINKRGYHYDQQLSELLTKNNEIQTPQEAYKLYESIKDDYDDTDLALCLSFEVLRINRKLQQLSNNP